MSRLLSYFARGCLVLVPTLATVYLLYLVVHTLDELLGVSLPGLGLALTLSLTTVVGFLVSNVIGRRVVRLVDRLFERVPLVKLLYGAIRDLIGALVEGKKTFGRAVAVRLTPGSEVRLLGFITRAELSALALPDHVSVYVPQGYNIGGQVLCVPRSSVEELDVASSELLTFLMSGGASGLGPRQPSANQLTLKDQI